MDKLAELHRTFDGGASWLRGPMWNGPGGDKLREIFPWHWLEESIASTEQWHPVILGTWMRGSAEELRAVGGFLAQNRFRTQDMYRRLRDRNEYLGCMAELRIGLLLSQLGASLTYEPSKPGAGPDWHVALDAFAMAIEVKLPRPSDMSRAADAAMTALMFKLMGSLPSPTAPAWLTLHADRDFRGPHAERPALDFSLIPALVDQIARDLPNPTTNWQRCYPGIGTLQVELGGPETGQYKVRGYMATPDHGVEVRKLKTLLQRAMEEQLRDEPRPIVIALDLTQDAQAGNYERELFAMLVREPWAARLSGILLVGALNNQLRSRNRLLVRPGCASQISPLVRAFMGVKEPA